ncbi:MAG: hypothetical protein AB1714_08735 [Acidobacteriota bacterium]
MGDPARNLKRLAWERVCRHVDGVTLTSTLASLYDRGWFDAFRQCKRQRMGDLLASSPGNGGYLHVGMRALASQGWFTREGTAGSEDLCYTLTPFGAAMLTHAPVYVSAARHYAAIGHDCIQALAGSCAEGVWGQLCEETLSRSGPSLEDHPSGDNSQRVRDHVDGLFFVPVLWALSERLHGLSAPSGDYRVDLEAAGIHGSLAGAVEEALARRGWIERGPTGWRLAPLGRAAWPMLAVFQYPLVYAALLENAGELLFGDLNIVRRNSGEEERHLDRESDIRFSGKVAGGACRAPFLEMVQQSFAGIHPDQQPAGILDVGSGDGTLLLDAFNSIRAQSQHGMTRDRAPFCAIGAEYNRAALRATAAALEASGAPGLAVFGDIDDPDAIARRLDRHHIRLDDMLVISKSVIHNRRYRTPSPSTPRLPGPESSSACVGDDGRPIAPSDLARNLVEHFARWRPYRCKHAMVVIEAHTVEPEIAAPHAGSTIATALDITHGYSGQLLVEIDVYNRAANAAGLRVSRQVTIGRQSLGHDYMTVTHFETA